MTKHECDYCGGFELDRPNLKGAPTFVSLYKKDFDGQDRKLCTFCHLELILNVFLGKCSCEDIDNILKVRGTK